MKNFKGITLIALVITIIILLILAGITLVTLTGDNGIIKRAIQAKEETKEKSAIEKVQLMLADYITEKYIGTKTLEEYLNEQKEKGELDEVTNNKDGTITVEVDGYEITIKEDEISIIEAVKIGGVKPIFEVLITKINGSAIEPSEQNTLTQKAITINITNIEKFDENYTIEIKSSSGEILGKETNVISGLTGQASYIIKKSGKYIITVTGTKEDKTGTTIKTEVINLAIPMFSKANGVIDIVWLDTDNTTRETPLSPAEHLGGLTAIKYNKTTNAEEVVTNPTTDTSWYNYEAQTGSTDGKTSYWANARDSNSNAYFVWIPRYAYKIIYFNTPAQAKAYRETGILDGVVGYSNVNGFVTIVDGEEILLEDTAPTNVTGRVKDSQYEDYIPHPAFNFEGDKARNMGRKI